MNFGFIYAIATAIIWGISYSIDQKILVNMSPLMFLFTNSVISSIILLPFIFFDDGTIKNYLDYSKANFLIIGLSIVLPIIANILILTSISLLGASTASIIEIAYPFFVVVFSAIFYKISPSLSFFVGGLFIFLGASIITYFYK